MGASSTEGHSFECRASSPIGALFGANMDGASRMSALRLCLINQVFDGKPAHMPQAHTAGEPTPSEEELECGVADVLDDIATHDAIHESEIRGMQHLLKYLNVSRRICLKQEARQFRAKANAKAKCKGRFGRKATSKAKATPIVASMSKPTESAEPTIAADSGALDEKLDLFEERIDAPPPMTLSTVPKNVSDVIEGEPRPPPSADTSMPAPFSDAASKPAHPARTPRGLDTPYLFRNCCASAGGLHHHT